MFRSRPCRLRRSEIVRLGQGTVGGASQCVTAVSPEAAAAAVLSSSAVASSVSGACASTVPEPVGVNQSGTADRRESRRFDHYTIRISVRVVDRSVDRKVIHLPPVREGSDGAVNGYRHAPGNGDIVRCVIRARAAADRRVRGNGNLYGAARDGAGTTQLRGPCADLCACDKGGRNNDSTRGVQRRRGNRFSRLEIERGNLTLTRTSAEVLPAAWLWCGPPSWL
jgi:hypothetical protein